MHRTSDLPTQSQRPALPASHHARRLPAARAVAGTFRGHKAAPACLSHCCATGTLASGSQDTTVKLWDARTRDAARTLKGQGAAITHVAHSPDGQLVVSGSEAGTLQVCGWGRGCATQCAHSLLGWCLCLARSRAERAHRHLRPQLLAAPPTPAQVWDMPTGRLLRELRGHTKRVHSLAFHPEETLLASASADRTVRFWDLGAGTGAPVEVDKAGPAAREARAVAFPSDGRALLAAAADGLRAYGWEPAREHDAVAVPWAKVCGSGVSGCVWECEWWQRVYTARFHAALRQGCAWRSASGGVPLVAAQPRAVHVAAGLQVSELCYFDGKAFGLGFAHDLIDMWTVDLTQVRPFGEPRRPATCPDRRRLSEHAGRGVVGCGGVTVRRRLCKAARNTRWKLRDADGLQEPVGVCASPEVCASPSLVCAALAQAFRRPSCRAPLFRSRRRGWLDGPSRRCRRRPPPRRACRPCCRLVAAAPLPSL